jgi:hypothetical protein
VQHGADLHLRVRTGKRCTRLHLWDEDSRRLLSFAGARQIRLAG